MFWDEKVAVSQQMYQTSTPAIAVCRIMGIFPFSVEKDGSKWVFKWSGISAFYSFVVGVVLLVVTYAGFFADVMVGKEKTIRIKSSTDVYIVFFDITVVELVVIFGVFITPLRFKSFCAYVECINDADATLLPTDCKKARRTSAILLTVILITTTAVLVADALVYFRIDGERSTRKFILESYLGFYVTHYIMLVTQYQLLHLGYCVKRRLKRLNKLLQMESGEDASERGASAIETNAAYASLVADFPMRPKLVGYPEELVKRNAKNYMMAKDEKLEKKQRFQAESERILKLMRAYLRLCDAVEIQNQLLGFVSAVLITGILLQLILSTYGLFVELAGSRRDPMFALMKSVWCVAHLIRLFMIVEPSHACTEEAQNTKDIVCKLLCSNIGEETKVQLDAFAMALFHRKIEYFASGLATVDRSLVTSVIGAITTYLVILLQFVKPE